MPFIYCSLDLKHRYLAVIILGFFEPKTFKDFPSKLNSDSVFRSGFPCNPITLSGLCICCSTSRDYPCIFHRILKLCSRAASYTRRGAPIFRFYIQTIVTDIGRLRPDVVRILLPTDSPKVHGSCRGKAVNLFVCFGIIDRHNNHIILNGLKRIIFIIMAVGFVSGI